MSFYFAYGANLSREQMTDRCPDSRPVARAVLRGYRLDFTKYSLKRGGGTADIVLSEGDEVWGALYEVSDADSESLDRREMCQADYERVAVTVHIDSGETVESWTYQVSGKKGAYEPSAGYLELIQEGAAEWKLPKSYQEFLHSLEPDHDHHTDPDE